MCLRDVEAGMNRELATVRRDSHAEFSGSISISHAAALTRAITERAATVFHVFFSPSSSSSSPSLHRGIEASRLMWRTRISSVGRPINPTTTQPPPPKKIPYTAGAPVIDRRKPQICSAALPGPREGEARRGGRRDKTGNQKEASRDQASSKADLISTSEVLEMSLMCWWWRGCERCGG